MLRRLWNSFKAAFTCPVTYVVSDIRRATDTFKLMREHDIEVCDIDAFRALPPRERARRSIDVLKRIGRFVVGMPARELDDHEIIAALLLGNGYIS